MKVKWLTGSERRRDLYALAAVTGEVGDMEVCK
jgi:hypothetical protein